MAKHVCRSGKLALWSPQPPFKIYYNYSYFVYGVFFFRCVCMQWLADLRAQNPFIIFVFFNQDKLCALRSHRIGRKIKW